MVDRSNILMTIHTLNKNILQRKVVIELFNKMKS